MKAAVNTQVFLWLFWQAHPTLRRPRKQEMKFLKESLRCFSRGENGKGGLVKCSDASASVMEVLERQGKNLWETRKSLSAHFSASGATRCFHSATSKRRVGEEDCPFLTALSSNTYPPLARSRLGTASHSPNGDKQNGKKKDSSVFLPTRHLWTSTRNQEWPRWGLITLQND